MYDIIKIYMTLIQMMTVLLYTENQDLSSAKEVFFINSGKKIARVIGLTVASLLGVIFLLMVISAAAFGSAGTVGVFGFNLFICDSSDYDSIPAGSAVISTSCAPYDLEEGNLVLYTTDPEDKNAPLAMGYYADFKMTDGVYYLHLVNNSDSTVISEDALIGKAGWCSPFLGAFIRFVRTPWGVLVMAVIPCTLLILFDVLRVKTYEKPIPEVIPQVKNQDDRPAQPQLTVGESGGASYKRNPSGKPSVSADSVLFTFDSAKKQHDEPSTGSAPRMSDADVLSLLNAPSPRFGQKPEKPRPEPPLFTAPAEKPASAPEKKRSDAFFAQSEAPQIGRNLTGKQTAKSSRSIIDLEDALAAAPSRTARPESRRSADILASKNRSDLITEDDDSRDKSRYEVDDILAGIEKRHQQ